MALRVIVGSLFGATAAAGNESNDLRATLPFLTLFQSPFLICSATTSNSERSGLFEYPLPNQDMTGIDWLNINGGRAAAVLIDDA
jgi:hypothetical protein